MDRFLRVIWLLALLPFLAPSCTILPKIEEKPVTHGLAAPESGPLVRASRSLAAGRKREESSFLLLDDAGEALNWRLALIDSARSSIDIQLYLWHGGASSEMLFERVIQAADRGVRVRILVDDFLLKANSAGLATLCRNHPNFEIRIFNPGRIRGNSLGSMTEMLANFTVLNRRMHNKTFTVDRCMTIVGGRNIGDHYYGMDEKYNFIDLDVLATGPVVAQVSDGFDEYWNDPAAFPGEYLSKRDVPEMVEEARMVFRETMANERHGKLRDYPVERHDWSGELAGLKRRMVHGRARFVQDSPNPEKDDRAVVSDLREVLSQKKSELHFASPYLIPSRKGLDNLAQLNSEGMRTTVLVPSLPANNHAVVDGHYRKYRARLVDGGSRLSEFRADPSEDVRALADVGPVRSERVTFHLKAVIGDRRKCFIGSLNLDPRAVDINTECGLLIESPQLAGELADLLDKYADSDNAWRVSRDEKGKLQWESRGEVRSSPPPASWGHRFLGWFAGLLPIESQI